MRVLNFTEAVAENYKVIYEGFCMTQKQFTPKEARRLDKVFTQLEDVGKSTGEKRGTLELLELKVIPTVIELEDSDYELIKSAIEPPNVQWIGIGARKAGIALTWLDECSTKPTLVKEEK